MEPASGGVVLVVSAGIDAPRSGGTAGSKNKPKPTLRLALRPCEASLHICHYGSKCKIATKHADPRTSRPNLAETKSR